MSSRHSITISHHACLTFNYVRYYLPVATFCYFKNYPWSFSHCLSCDFLLYELHWIMACYDSIIQYRFNIDWPLIPEPPKAPLISRCERFRRKRRKLSTSINIVEWISWGHHARRQIIRNSFQRIQPLLKGENYEKWCVFFRFTVRAHLPVKLVPVNPFSTKCFLKWAQKSFKPKETRTHTFICLCESDQWVVPSREEKVILKEAGLGEKKITFEKYGGYQQLQSSLLKEFPKLSEGGGFQLLRSSGARRSLDLIPIPTMGYDIPYLKDCLGQAIGYVRPLQKDLDRSPLSVPVG